VADTTPSNPHPPTLTDADVRRVARLARVAISETEIPTMREQLGAILGHAQRLLELDLSGVEPMTSPIDATAPMRGDAPGPTIDTDGFLRMAPESVPPFLKVPKVIGGGSG